MRKTFLIIAIIASAVSSVFSQTNTLTTDTGVVINGVRWATRNVAAPGTFAAKAEDVGMFYQWNSKVGWPSTGTIGKIAATNGTTKWDSHWTGGYANPSATDTWILVNDPSPKGWRVPTYAEIQTLFDEAKVTYTGVNQNGIYSEKFTDKTTGNTLFLPDSGFRSGIAGSIGIARSGGYYWGSGAFYSGYGFCIIFNCLVANWGGCGRAYGFAVRPVAK